MQDYTIATGASRMAVKWKNTQTSLEAFIERLENPIVTAETAAQYAAMKKEDKDAAKDVGGFVAGSLADGKRGAGRVSWRSMVTLDLDNVDVRTQTALDMILARCPYKWIVHPTHSHQDHAPRLRLIVPLETNVTEDQYEPIARRIAADINIDWFDPTTFQASRLMFWPSVPLDMQETYAQIFEVHEGPLCAGANVLTRYTDWRNVGEWPTTGREADHVQHRAKVQGNPLEKPGVVGIFCRAYSIQEVIATHLSDVYVPTDKENRYTYAAGSTVGGLVVYDDIFAYDNHGTSPASGTLCNAFDLVRIHKFSALDERCRLDTEITKRPSYQEMCAWVESDEGFKRQRAKELKERQEAAETEFDYEDEKTEKDWREDIIYDKTGLIPAKLIQNVVLILNNDDALKDRLFVDEFAGRSIVKGGTPWNENTRSRDWTDNDDANLRAYLEEEYKLYCPGKVADGISKVFTEHTVHPVREYLENLPEWDGTDRVADLLINYLGAEPTDYTRAVTKTHLVAAVARVMQPGIKYDTMITLSGKQGVGKSSFIRILCGDQWFNDSIRDFKGKEPFEQIQGSWMVEIGELAAYRKSDKEEFKAFISKTSDVYRPAYGRRTVHQPRQCIFWGTTNEVQFLRDITGERRTWPVAVGVVPIVMDIFEQLPAERDQIWAEALEAYEDEWPLVLSPAMERIADEVRGTFTEEDARVYAIEEYLEKELPLDWKDWELMDRQGWIDDYDRRDMGVKTEPRESVTALEVWCECMHGSMNDFPKRDNGEINNILNNLPGWERSDRVNLGKAYEGRRPKVSFVRKKR